MLNHLFSCVPRTSVIIMNISNKVGVNTGVPLIRELARCPNCHLFRDSNDFIDPIYFTCNGICNDCRRHQSKKNTYCISHLIYRISITIS